MKMLIVILLGLLIAGCDESANSFKKKPTEQNKKNKQVVVTTGKKEKKDSKSAEVAKDVDSVARYATGETHISIWKAQEQKIKNIQNQHNSEIEAAIEE